MGINPEYFYDYLEKLGMDFYTGVPDSTLKEFTGYIEYRSEAKNHIVAANEGNAVGIAAGYYLSSGKIPVVYMQNSGLGNAINPITSLIHEKVYSIPLMFVIGWRGEPGVKDEPQHIKQGEITEVLLDLLDIKYTIIDKTTTDIDKLLEKAKSYMMEYKRPYALLIKKNSFIKVDCENSKKTRIQPRLSREIAIGKILDKINEESIVISTTGKISREVYEYRLNNKVKDNKDFLTVGSMGHSSSIALGISLNKDSKIVCLDGDGSTLMHMGSLPIIGTSGINNFTHIVLNNGAHDSVGGQSTIAFDIDMLSIAKGSGYDKYIKVDNIDELEEIVKVSNKFNGTLFIEVIVSKGARGDLGRPRETPIENKEKFMENINI